MRLRTISEALSEKSREEAIKKFDGIYAVVSKTDVGSQMVLDADGKITIVVGDVDNGDLNKMIDSLDKAGFKMMQNFRDKNYDYEIVGDSSIVNNKDNIKDRTTGRGPK